MRSLRFALARTAHAAQRKHGRRGYGTCVPYCHIPLAASAPGRKATFGWPLHFLEARLPTTNVYIDGFNLYYGALQSTPYRWLDLERLCEFLLPGNAIGEIKYFTARVKSGLNLPAPTLALRCQT